MGRADLVVSRDLRVRHFDVLGPSKQVLRGQPLAAEKSRAGAVLDPVIRGYPLEGLSCDGGVVDLRTSMNTRDRAQLKWLGGILHLAWGLESVADAANPR